MNLLVEFLLSLGAGFTGSVVYFVLRRRTLNKKLWQQTRLPQRN